MQLGKFCRALPIGNRSFLPGEKWKSKKLETLGDRKTYSTSVLGKSASNRPFGKVLALRGLARIRTQTSQFGSGSLDEVNHVSYRHRKQHPFHSERVTDSANPISANTKRIPA